MGGASVSKSKLKFFKKKYIGKYFSRLKVLKLYKKFIYNRYRIFAKCKCSCGTITKILFDNLLNKLTTSCKCVQREMLLKRNKNNITHGESNNTITIEYRTWCSMK